jgi:hypothetical protein
VTGNCEHIAAENTLGNILACWLHKGGAGTNHFGWGRYHIPGQNAIRFYKLENESGFSCMTSKQMRFCPDCNNMLHEFSGNNIKCRSCPYSEPIPTLVYERVLGGKSSARLSINPYIVHDPTLPRFTHIDCFNKDCPTIKGSVPRDVVGVKEDSAKLVWSYVCAVCKTDWTQTSRG